MKVGKYMMHLDPLKRGISSSLWGQGYREPGFMWIMKQEAKGDLGIDLGANLGYATLHMCDSLNKIIAIEPDKRSRKLLKKNIKENNFLDKVKIYNFAISDKNGEETIYLSKKNPNLNSLCGGERLKKKKDFLKTKTIKTKTIDSLNLDPNFIKMDIEGYEIEAIKGGMETFRNSKNCKILIEVHPQFYSKKRNFAKTLDNLFNIGYKVKYIVSAACACPDKFRDKNYEPFKIVIDEERERGIYRDISQEDAIDFCAFINKQKDGDKVSLKIARSILLVK